MISSGFDLQGVTFFLTQLPITNVCFFQGGQGSRGGMGRGGSRGNNVSMVDLINEML